ncbi:MAG: hypothetical protein ABJF04_06645 [Reichenbachiella sp.]|uniref:hypothetical protein n=1 Tax=Reichenbachiella sp. TaxID=2184521 RepID=UPI0032632B34
MKPAILITTFTLLLVSCQEQEPFTPNSSDPQMEVFAQIHNSNPDSYVIYRKLSSDGRFTRETVLNFGETKELIGFTSSSSYFVRASREGNSADDFDFEWEIQPNESNIYISF